MTFVINKAGTDAFPQAGLGALAKDILYSGPNRVFATAALVLAATPLYNGEIVYAEPAAGVQGGVYQGYPQGPGDASPGTLAAGQWMLIAERG